MISTEASSALEGLGLHRGEPASLEIVRAPGPVAFSRGEVVRPIRAFRLVASPRATSLVSDAFAVSTVEHLFAALAGLAVRAGCRSVLGGGEELPLLDGTAMPYVRKLEQLGLAPSPPELRVAREGRVEVDGSVYELHPGGGVEVSVDVDLPPSCAREARWDGEPASFMAIAGARTFARAEDVEELSRLGVARHVDPQSVLVVSDDAIQGVAPIARDEPARHKLLDLIGDVYFWGGPPRGSLRVTRPGHARNHRAFEQALAQGILVRE